uniref:Uncharacterized protein n=1 Tax=Setaria viridis TaxID=4556 RepID=A0A4U6VZM6_SETVI|nr:hypothetical protein SEVIR_2G244300v2 [Setaria viridis]
MGRGKGCPAAMAPSLRTGSGEKPVYAGIRCIRRSALAFSGLRAGDLLPRARSRQGAGAAGSGARPCAPAERPTARLQLSTCATQNLTNFSDQPRLHME